MHFAISVLRLAEENRLESVTGERWSKRSVGKIVMTTKNLFRAVAPVALAGAFLASAAPASAAVVLCQDGPGIDLTANQCIYDRLTAGNDNDDIAAVKEAIFEATGVNVNISLFGKTPENLSLFGFTPSGDPDGNLVVDWNVLNGTAIKYVTIKAASEFKVYEYAGLGATSGQVSTFGMLTPNLRNQPEISHISFWTAATAVPEPGTWALLILGFGAVGGAMRSARKSRPVLNYI